MEGYVQIKLLPDPEFTGALLMSALFAKLHRALVEIDSRSIGVSFPEFSNEPRTLGSIMRIHGRPDVLAGLMAKEWLKGMNDHAQVSGVLDVPECSTYRAVRRVQPKTNAERLRRRHIKRHRISEQQAKERIPDSVEANVSLPYVSVRSRSTGHKFCVFIEHMPLQAEPVEGEFTAYGLSPVATVPWF